MPKKGKWGKNTKNKGTTEESKMLEKDPNSEEYALVTKKLGSGRFLLKLNMKDTEIIGRLCGKMRRGRNKRRNWVDVDSVVLVGLRDFQENIVDIVHVYDQTEVRQLRKIGAFIEEQRRDHLDGNAENDEEFAFDFDEI